ncbi:Sulfite reduction-associated complex DsrMKJOP protein DsrP (= HmeB) [hydrothermal vent metagenome]|uniref:Sulfite reduction-associated complex DsrMKJOP protein DsrP (= HmeB) n=1 Tax=hydrothermal vent metagenome TaxID=652676 RepID=A0A3B0T2I9_9ZZZZ
MAIRTTYSQIGTGPGFYSILAFLGAFIAAGAAAFFYVEHYGHIVTGMTNKIVWGMPHVFAIFLIIAASGALNVASLGSVFNKTAYKPLSRMSGVLAMALLAGGLAVLLLDLGRPDRLIVAITTYNFKSIFAWNIILYSGFMVIVGAYLYVQMAKGMERYKKPLGIAAFIWRLALTTGTGSIFGWLVARQGYDAAIMAPLFIAMSLSFGMACFILVVKYAGKATDRPLGMAMTWRMGRLMGVMAAAVLYFTTIRHLGNLYAAEHSGVEQFILFGGNIYTKLFWFGQILIGGLIPLALVFAPHKGEGSARVTLAAVLIIIGGFAQLYVIIVGGQAFPLVMFPGMEVSSSFQDGMVGTYTPSLPEIALGLGGVAIAMLITVFALMAFKLLPKNMSDAALDPHLAAKAK